MMGTTPIIVVKFQTQQIYCVRDKNGKSKKEARTRYTLCTTCGQVEAEELGEEAIYPIWRLREMMQVGVQALI